MKIAAFLALFVLFYSAHSYVFNLNEYQASLNTWNNIKPSTYTYVQYIEPSLVEVDITTTIAVTDGKVVKRAYHYDDGETVTDWVEDTPEEIGSHEEGFPALTLDQVYSQCVENVLVYDAVLLYIVNFKTFSNGLIKECSFYPANASDGPLGGVTLSKIQLS